MSDNKLKIRIQIQQPKVPEETGETEVTGEAIPDIDTQDYLEKPPFDWRKISLAVFVLVAVIGLVGSLLFSQNDDETDINDIHSETGSVTDLTEKFNYYGDDPVNSEQDYAASSEKNEKSLSEIKDTTVTAENTVNVESGNERIIVPDSKPGDAKKHSPPTPALKPE